MHGPSLATATLLVVLLLGGSLVQASAPSSADAIALARRKLDDHDGVAAVTILEAALPEASAGKDRDAVLDLLKPAYESAARQAEAAGRGAEAETYRENLKILTRKSRPARSSPAPSTPAAPTRPTPEPINPPEPIAEPVPLPSAEPVQGSATPLPVPPTAPPGPDTSVPPALPPMLEPGEAKPVDPPVASPPAPSSIEPTADLATADAAFVAEDYAAAGRIYARLAEEKKLPAERRDQWFYCRAFAVVSRINAHPKTESEWAIIHAEIEQTRALNPKNYLGEYLRNLAVERQGPIKKPKVARAMVVRGQAPDEPVKDRPVRTASTVAPTNAPADAPADPSPAPTPAPTPAPNPAAARIGTAAGRWQSIDTANFRIYHADPALAAQVAQAAEAARRDQLKRWSKPTTRAGWQPLCEIYLYPTARQYASMTGQPEDSPGFSTMGMNAGRITSRRINLRADHPTVVQAVLPHEITHVILADHFTEKQIPRWADEGLAVLSEPVDEQQRRAADLNKPLADNRLFAVDVLMSMDYPDERYWSLYYAQSVSLTRFLVEMGTPAQMIQFLQESQRDGYEPALRRVYRIEGYPDLQRRWIAYARTKADTRNVATTRPDAKVR